MAIFEFKLNTWMNQRAPHCNRPVAPGTGGTAVSTNLAGSIMDGTARPEQPVLFKAVPPASLARPAATYSVAVSIAHRAVGSGDKPALDGCLFTVITVTSHTFLALCPTCHTLNSLINFATFDGHTF
jgi:hypothetical protein